MKVKELINTGKINKDHWLAKAVVYDEDVEIINNCIVWKCGVWQGGEWQYGVWHDGVWKSGWSSLTRCRWPVLIGDDKIRIGCEERTIEEWDAFFASDEELETPRNTEAFDRIEKAYKIAKYALELERGLK